MRLIIAILVTLAIVGVMWLFLTFAPHKTQDTGMEIDEWTFDQAENVACFTLRQILKDGAPILYVTHDADDHGWQFLTSEHISMADAAIVSMREIIELDSTLLEIGDMPPGHSARRKAVGEPWEIEAISE